MNTIIPNSKQPDKPTTQKKIAELLGWKRLDDHGHPGIFWGENPEGFWDKVPNWPRDRDAALQLDVESAYQSIGENLVGLYLDSIGFQGGRFSNGTMLFSLMIQIMADPDFPMLFCLAWVEHKGYRWAPCPHCKGTGATHIRCSDCKGQGGKWVKA